MWNPNRVLVEIDLDTAEPGTECVVVTRDDDAMVDGQLVGREQDGGHPLALAPTGKNKEIWRDVKELKWRD